jgi:integrase
MATEESQLRARAQPRVAAFPCSADYRFARWHEIDFDAREWRVPRGRMKMKEQRRPFVAWVTRKLSHCVMDFIADSIFHGV